jgi:1,4-dihydroxy-2-naphthoate octaprenyltransferase
MHSNYPMGCILHVEMQLGMNLHNDYVDFVKGVDTEK